MIKNTRLSFQVTILFVGITVTFFIYLQGIPGDFIFDDYHNIVNNKSLYIDKFTFDNLKKVIISNNSGLLKRPISMLSFAFNGYFGGINPSNLKLTNIFIHLINSLLVFSLTRITFIHLLHSFPELKHNTLSSWLPLIITTAWLIHPINLTSILYSVQRMTSLSALFVFAGLNHYLRLRFKQIKEHKNSFLVIFILIIYTILGMLTKENAAILPLLALCYELSILKFKTANKHDRNRLIFFYTLFISIAIFALVLTFIYQPYDLVGGFEHRDFNLIERLLTESRVLWFYIFLILTPKLSQFGIFHDDIIISTSLLSPLSTLISCLALLGLLIGAFTLRKKLPLVFLSCLLFFSAHSMESTIFPLEIAHEHRNYIAAYAFLMGLFFSIVQLFGHKLYPCAFFCIVLISFFLLITTLRASLWGQPVNLILVTKTQHPDSARSNYESAQLYTRLLMKEENHDIKEKYYKQAKLLYLQSFMLKKSYLSGLIGSIWLDSLLKEEKNDENTFNLLLKNLSIQKISPKSVRILQEFNYCIHTEICKFDKTKMHTLLLTSIKNPQLTKVGHSSLMTEASLTALALGHYQEAVNISQDASKFDPDNQQLKLNFISILIQLKLYDFASIKLNELKLSGLKTDMVNNFKFQKKLLHQLTNPTKHDK